MIALQGAPLPNDIDKRIIEDHLNRPLLEERQRAAEQRAETYKQAILSQRATEFIQAWNKFAEKYNQGMYDIKLAKAVEKAFERLRNTEGWYTVKDGDDNPRRGKGTSVVPARGEH